MKDKGHTKERSRSGIGCIPFASEVLDHAGVLSGLEAVDAAGGPARDGDLHVWTVLKRMCCIAFVEDE